MPLNLLMPHITKKPFVLGVSKLIGNNINFLTIVDSVYCFF